MSDSHPEYPAPEYSALVKRAPRLPSDARAWRGNGSREQADHHELVNPGSGPMYLHLEWSSEAQGDVVAVGDYWINLRGLANRHFVQEKGKQVRLRFVRSPDGIVGIQANDKSPFLPVGVALFDR